ncbi:hypothetical protein A2U01_0080788, partial [Trifolium medium]|nr:hypothetical protein [Trifolium medium]
GAKFSSLTVGHFDFWLGWLARGSSAFELATPSCGGGGG